VDNLTHSLVGAALSELALRDASPTLERRLFLAVGVVTSNLPDIDLVYTGVTPAPLGYLLHHRGHTHTIVGLLAQGLLVAALCWIVPRIRRLPGASQARLGLLIAAGLSGHLLLDAWNSYGVHPFYPLDAGWYYGDAVFIFEPWLWMLLGVAAAAARSRGVQAGVAVLILLPCAALGYVGIVPWPSLAGLAAAGLALAWGARALSSREMAALALTLSVLSVTVLFGLSNLARARVARALGPTAAGRLLDIVLNPNPAWPLCWAVIAIEKDEGAGEYALHRGTLSLLPTWQRANECPSHRLAGLATTAGETSRLAWHAPVRQPLQPLRGLNRRDCWVRAWLQFGRAPALREQAIVDLRFETGARRNFTAMRLPPLAQDAPCPAHLTSWGTPRADLLDPAR
jgi:inner membrane protein